VSTREELFCFWNPGTHYLTTGGVPGDELQADSEAAIIRESESWICREFGASFVEFVNELLAAEEREPADSPFKKFVDELK
jgi:hypothetical protein